MMTLPRWLRSQRTPPNPNESEGQGGAQTTAVAGDRGIASINRTRSLQSRISNLLAMGLMSGLGLGLLTWYYAHALSHPSSAATSSRAPSTAGSAASVSLPPLGPIGEPSSPPAPSVIQRVLGPPPAPPPVKLPVYRPVAFVPQARPVNPRIIALDRRLAGPVFFGPETVTGSVSSAANESESGSINQSSAEKTSQQSERSVTSSRLASLLRPTATKAVSAQLLPPEHLLLPEGTFIDCTLETAIDSSLPGLTTCITATDTFSADGKVVLLERGTKLIGETRGEVQQGVARVFVLWTEARTPDGVVVALASPGTDALGRSGLSGSVNRHFLERFGAAVLVSVINGAVQAAVESQSNGGAVIYNPESSQDVITQVLKSTINIPPTVTFPNGSRIQVLVARDLDFRSVYELRPLDTRR